jgi:hypothetical protein
VYRSFRAITEFMSELKELMEERSENGSRKGGRAQKEPDGG